MPVITATYTETLQWHDEKFEKYAEKFALVLITLSHFKLKVYLIIVVNQSYEGQPVCNALLKKKTVFLS